MNGSASFRVGVFDDGIAPARVWSALAAPGLAARVWGEGAALALVPGAPVVLPIGRGVIAQVEPPHRITFAFATDADRAAGVEGHVALTLDANNDGGYDLDVTHAGFTDDAYTLKRAWSERVLAPLRAYVRAQTDPAAAHTAADAAPDAPPAGRARKTWWARVAPEHDTDDAWLAHVLEYAPTRRPRDIPRRAKERALWGVMRWARTLAADGGRGARVRIALACARSTLDVLDAAARTDDALWRDVTAGLARHGAQPPRAQLDAVEAFVRAPTSAHAAAARATVDATRQVRFFEEDAGPLHAHTWAFALEACICAVRAATTDDDQEAALAAWMALAAHADKPGAAEVAALGRRVRDALAEWVRTAAA